MILSKLKLKIQLNQTGDTIVEVLISIGILSVILAGAYATSNNSLLAERAAQEHAVALTIAQTQLEDLQSVYQASGSSSFNLGTTLCYGLNTTNKITPISGSSSTQYCNVPSKNPTIVQSPSTPTTSSSGVPFDYKVKLSQSSPSPSSPITYESLVTWPSLSSSNTNHVELYYRLN